MNCRLISSMFLILLILVSLVYLNLQSNALDFKRFNYKVNNQTHQTLSLKEVLKRLIREDINKPINYLYSTYVAGRILRIKCSTIHDLLGIDPRHVFILAFVDNSWRNLPIRIYDSKLVANVGTYRELTIYLIPRRISGKTFIDIKLPSLPPKPFNLDTKEELMKLPRYVMNGKVIPIYLTIRITEGKLMKIELLIAISIIINTEVIKNSMDYKYVSEYFDVYGINGFYNRLRKAADEGIIKVLDINKLIRKYESSTIDVVTMKVLPSFHVPEPPTYEPTIIEIVPPWRTWGTNATLGMGDELHLRVKYLLKPPEVSDNVETEWVTAHILVRDLGAPNQTTTTTSSTPPPSPTTTSTTSTTTKTRTTSTTSTSTSTTPTETSTSTTTSITTTKTSTSSTTSSSIPTFTPPPRKFTTTFTPTITISPPTSFTIMSKIHPKTLGSQVCKLIVKYYEDDELKETYELIIDSSINDFKITNYPESDNIEYDLTLKGCKGRWEVSILSLSVAHYYPKILESNLTNKPINIYFLGSEGEGYGIIDLPAGISNLTAQLPIPIPEGVAIAYDKFYNEELPRNLKFLIKNRGDNEAKVTICLGSTDYLCNSTYLPASSSNELTLSINYASVIVDYFAAQSNLPLIVNVVRSNPSSEDIIEIYPEHSLFKLLARPLYLMIPESRSSTYYASTLYPDDSNLWELQATVKGITLSSYLFGIYKSEGGLTVSLYSSALNEHISEGSVNDLYFDLLFNGAYARAHSSDVLKNDWGIRSFKLIIKYPNLDQLPSDDIKYYLILPSVNPLIRINLPQIPPIVATLTTFIATIIPGLNIVAGIVGTIINAYNVIAWIWNKALKPALYSKPTLHRGSNELIVSWEVGPLQREPYVLALRVKLFEVPMCVMKTNVKVTLDFLATSGRYSLSDEIQDTLVLNPLK